MSEKFTIERLLEDKNITAGRKYAMQGIAAEYLSRMGILGSVLEDRSPAEQFRHYLDELKTTDPHVEDIANQRMLYAAAGFADPGDEAVRQELIERQSTLDSLEQ